MDTAAYLLIQLLIVVGWPLLVWALCKLFDIDSNQNV